MIEGERGRRREREEEEREEGNEHDYSLYCIVYDSFLVCLSILNQLLCVNNELLIRYYLKSRVLVPRDGKPYNQLAVISINSVSY